MTTVLYCATVAVAFTAAVLGVIYSTAPIIERIRKSHQ